MRDFRRQLLIGKMGESIIALWLKSIGFHVLPVYEKETDDFKGPQFFCEGEELVAPDMFVFNPSAPDGYFWHGWVEAKRKTRFSWYGIEKKFVTGINYNHYLDYLKVQKYSDHRVLLFFLHVQSDTWPRDVERWKAPEECPTGLFYCAIDKPFLYKSADDDGVRMVYWQYGDLTQAASMEELKPFLHK